MSFRYKNVFNWNSYLPQFGRKGEHKSGEEGKMQIFNAILDTTSNI